MNTTEYITLFLIAVGTAGILFMVIVYPVINQEYKSSFYDVFELKNSTWCSIGLNGEDYGGIPRFIADCEYNESTEFYEGRTDGISLDPRHREDACEELKSILGYHEIERRVLCGDQYE